MRRPGGQAPQHWPGRSCRSSRARSCRICEAREGVPRHKMTMARPEWMKKAGYSALGLRAETFGASGARHSVYVILLHDPRWNGRWGLYVGQTSRDPDWRFDQHKAGYKASRAVKRFGVCLLPELVEHLNPMMDWESLELEAALAGAFRGSGVPWVEGGH
jgi:hypothetical protein